MRALGEVRIMKAFPPLLTPRLRLRPLRPDDAPTLAAYRADPEVARYQGWSMGYTLEQAQNLIAEMTGRVPGDPDWTQIGLADRQTDTLLGDLALRAYDPRHAEIGFTLARSAWGQGYAAEGVLALLDHAFGPLNLHRVTAGIDPRNFAADRLLTRLGFRHEGRHIQSYFDGQNWLDEDQYALLRSEWTR